MKASIKVLVLAMITFSSAAAFADQPASGVGQTDKVPCAAPAGKVDKASADTNTQTAPDKNGKTGTAGAQ